MKILIFTEGTILEHNSNSPREQLVKEVETKDPRVKDYANYIPIENAVNIIQSWADKGDEIYYLTSRSTFEEVDAIRKVLKKNKFPSIENLLFRKDNEEYKSIAESLLPDILIEDDCESIGGSSEMTYTHINAELKNKIRSIVVKEFGGIDKIEI